MPERLCDGTMADGKRAMTRELGFSQHRLHRFLLGRKEPSFSVKRLFPVRRASGCKAPENNPSGCCVATFQARLVVGSIIRFRTSTGESQFLSLDSSLPWGKPDQHHHSTSPTLNASA